MKALVISIIYEESSRSGKPILVIIDDTISSKTKPSSKAKHPIEAAYFHFSHLKKRQDYGHHCLESDTYDFNDGYRKLSKVIDMERWSSLYDLAIASKDKSAFLEMAA